MQVLKQSTERIVRVGPFVDATNGVTPETGVTLGAADQAEAMKAGGGASVDLVAATWAAVTGADGWYDLTLSTAVTDTVGDLTIVVQDASVCLPVMVRFTVVEEAVYDALYGASAAGYGTAQTGDSYAIVNSGTHGNAALKAETALIVADTDLIDDATSGLAKIATDVAAILVDTAAMPTAAGIADAVWDEDVTTHATAATTGLYLYDLLTGFDTTGFDSGDYLTDIKTTMEAAGGHLALILEDTGTTIPATLTLMSGATFDTSTDSLEAIRNRGDAAWATATGFSTHAAADVVTALGTGSTLTALATAANLALVDTIVDKLDTAMEIDGAVYRFTVNALEQAPAGGGAGSTDWTADERTAIRSILGIPAAGSTPTDPTVGALYEILEGFDSTGFDSATFTDDVAAAVLAVIGTGWTESLTEAYPAYGATPTAAQMMWMIYAGMLQRELDGTSMTILESDGATAAATYTISLNTQGYPTKVVRTS